MFDIHNIKCYECYTFHENITVDHFFSKTFESNDLFEESFSGEGRPTY